MRYAAFGALVALFAWFSATPLPAAAQEATTQQASRAASPDIHAYFEYEYALNATYLSMSVPHREQVAAVMHSFLSGSLSEADAAKRIDDTLSADERNAISKIEQSFWTSLQQIYANADDSNPVKASLRVTERDTDPGRFLLVIVVSSLPSSSPSPNAAFIH